MLSMGFASAATASTPHDTLVDKLVSKFNLNKSDVQKVIDENRQEHEAAREQKMKERLDQAVKDKKITQEQEDKLIAKLKVLQADRKELKQAKQAERDARKAKMDEFKKWLSDNKIPEEVARPMGGPGHRGMMHGEGTPHDN